MNRVRTARETHAALAREGHDVHLVTGRMRPLDRIDALERIGPAVAPDRDRNEDELSVVVATQAIEVGARTSALNALVTECAAVDSLRQRFGRLDRRGTCVERTGSPAHAWIIGPQSVVGANKRPDPIYGESIRITWEELESRCQSDAALDVGPTALQGFPNGASAPRAKAPLLLATHMDAWVQTRPEPPVQPSVDWFLHGIDDQDRPADVSILWRWDRSSEALRLVPPRQAEFLQVPVAAARAWLAGDAEVDFADAGQSPWGQRPSDAPPANGWVRWTGSSDGSEDHVGAKDIRPGDVLVVDPAKGGLTAGTWDPSSTEPVEDLGDEAQIAYHRRATLRLDARLPYVTSPPTPAADAAAADIAVSERVADWLAAAANEPGQKTDWMASAIQRLGSNFEMHPVGLVDAEPSTGYYILAERYQKTGKPVVEAETMDGSDETGSFTSTGTTLRLHLDGVGERAGRIADRLGLPHEIAKDLRLAGRLHDLGKVDSRFQSQLVGGDPVELEMRRDEPLAKSLPGARKIWRYPKGMRHEVASVAMIESNADVLGFAHDQDLVLHLVGTHHGWGRPLPPIIDDPEPQRLSYTVDGHLLETVSDLSASPLALEMTDRFWRLVERYGYHGLAWLEAVLRLADHQQSAEEAMRP